MTKQAFDLFNKRLSDSLDANNPRQFSITDKAVLAVFRKWAERRKQAIQPA